MVYFWEDCEGVPNGGKELDECGVCGGDGSTCGKFLFQRCHHSNVFLLLCKSILVWIFC